MAIEIPPLVYPVTVFLQLLDIAYARAGRPRLIVSSWLRSDQRQQELVELGTGALRSLHPKGLAMDLQGSLAARQALGAAWRALGLDALEEPPGPSRINPVLHIELDGPRLRALGVDFR